MSASVSIIIPTCNGGSTLARTLDAIRNQRYGGRVQLLVLDSGSTDGTVERADWAGAEVRRIAPGTFHHAGTRNLGLQLARFEKVLFMVQDAVPATDYWLRDMVACLEGNTIAAAYAGHLPQDDADTYARFEVQEYRTYLGSEQSLQQLTRSSDFEEAPYWEAYRMARLDNVCAIYRRAVLESIAFPEVDFAEDLAWARDALRAGHAILYQPRVQVKHSHNRSPEYNFKRQVINAVWRAKIMGRVPEDLSFMELPDLLALTSGMQHAARQFLEGGNGSRDAAETAPLLVECLQRRFPYPQRLIESLPPDADFDAGSRLDEALQKTRVERAAVQELGRIMSHIQEHFALDPDRMDFAVLDQVAARVLGRVYGEWYASRLLRAAPSRVVEDFMLPYLRGV